MPTKVTTLTDFIIEEERKFPGATGSFTLLLTQIENCAKIIASHLKKTGLIDVLGKTGKSNVYGDEVERLDEWSNNLLIDTLSASGQVYAVGSEEIENPIMVKKHPGEYVVFFDPLDGSSNIDVNGMIGTIFSIYHKSKNLLQPGRKQIAAGYILYGSSVMFVYTAGHRVNGFTLDPAIGSFLLSHPDMRIPEKGKTYTINEAQEPLFFPDIKKYLHELKQEGSYSGRNFAAMVGDVHRILIKGGVFMYPANSKLPRGKLRLFYEINPLSYIVEKAGGMALSDNRNPLDIVPLTFADRRPIIMGGKKEVMQYKTIITR